MIGWIIGGATVAVLASRARARARRSRLAARSRARQVPVAETWRAIVRYKGAKGDEQLDIGNRDGGYSFAHIAAGWPDVTRDPKNLANLLELTADTVAERIDPAAPTIVLELYRSTIEGPVARVELGAASVGDGGRLIAQAQATFAGGKGSRTQNYAGDNAGQLAFRFLDSQLRISWEEGYFA